jgi:LmbE family N-acetylglucosaminyl deacetylase
MTTKMKDLEAFDEVERLIVVAAHPDDMETLCGGTIVQLTQRGGKSLLRELHPG